MKELKMMKNVSFLLIKRSYLLLRYSNSCPDFVDHTEKQF